MPRNPHEGTDVVTKFWFETFQREFGGFGWQLVEGDGDCRRVLARSDGDFRSEKKARRAVCALQEVVGAAEFVDDTLRAFQDVVVHATILDATDDDDACDVPASTFMFAPDADPLVIAESPARDTRLDGRRRRRRPREDDAGRPAMGPAVPHADLSGATQVRRAPAAKSGTTTPTKVTARESSRKTAAGSRSAATGASAAGVGRRGTAKKAGGSSAGGRRGTRRDASADPRR
jgi:hypothetical protein